MDARRRLPVAVLVASVVLGLLTGVTAVVVGVRGDRPPHAPRHRAVARVSGAEPFAVGVLRRWDVRRSRAYADTDAAALRALYVPGSRAGAADLTVLRGYRARDLRVTGMRTQVLGVRVVGRTPRRLTLVVTDVLAGAVATSAGRRWALPHDRPSTRRVVLMRYGRRWRVAEVYTVAAG
jgi:hypothetical protein